MKVIIACGTPKDVVSDNSQKRFKKGPVRLNPSGPSILCIIADHANCMTPDAAEATKSRELPATNLPTFSRSVSPLLNALADAMPGPLSMKSLLSAVRKICLTHKRHSAVNTAETAPFAGMSKFIVTRALPSFSKRDTTEHPSHE
jgi:hypothetical protein